MIVPNRATPPVMRRINRLPRFIRAVTWVLIVCFVGLQVPTVAAQTTRAAKNLNFESPCTEEDNVNIPIYGNYVSEYEITATSPEYYPLEYGQEDLCGTDYTHCDLAWDMRPTAQVAYYDATSGDLKFVWQAPPIGNQDPWWYPVETLDTGGNVGQYASLAYEPSDRYGVGNSAPPTIAYYDAGNGDLKYIIRDSWGNWGTPEVVDSAGDVGRYTALRIDRSRGHHIVYYDASNGDLKYAYKANPEVGGGWSTPVALDSSGDVGQHAAMAIGADGVLHVVYYATTGALKYTRKDASGWSVPVALDSGVGSYGSVAGRWISITATYETPAGKTGGAYDGFYPHVAYYDAAGGNLKYVYAASSGWSTPATLDSTGDVGQYASIAFGPAGDLHLAYYDASNADLKYLHKDAGVSNWTAAETLDSAGDVGRHVSLGVAAKGQPHIAYYDLTNQRLKYVSKTKLSGGNWVTPTVLDTGGVGQFASLVTSGYVADKNQAGEELYNDGHVVIHGVDVPGWSLQTSMVINVIGGLTRTNDYIRIQKRIADENDFPEVFVLYGNGYARLLPHPPAGRQTPVCFGASMIVGPALEDILYPIVPIRSLLVDPLQLTMDLTYADDSSAKCELKVERERSTLRVSDITYDTLTKPFTTVRSMWVTDDNCDVAKIVTQYGEYGMDPVPEACKEDPNCGHTHQEWTELPSDWWFLHRPVYSRHNTSAPDMDIRVLGPVGNYVARQAEDYTSVIGLTKVAESNASGGTNVAGYGDATYSLNLSEPISNAVLNARYIGGTGGKVLSVYVDSVLRATFATQAATIYKMTGELPLGIDLAAGAHTVTLALSPAGNAQFDYFALHAGVETEPLKTWNDVWGSGVWWTSSTSLTCTTYWDPVLSRYVQKCVPSQYDFSRAGNAGDHSTRPGELPNSAVILYNKAGGDNASEDAYGCFAVSIPPTDFRQYDYFSFWVYNDGSPLTLRVRFEDTQSNRWETAWAGGQGDLTMKTPVADWENTVVDLTRTFSAQDIDMGAISLIAFTVDPGNTTSVGSFLMDDFSLLKAPDQAPIEVFENDLYGWSTAEAGPFTVDLTSVAFHNGGGANDLGQQALAIQWPSKLLLLDSVVYKFDHETDAPAGRIGHLTNLTVGGNNALTMWVKSDTDTDFTIGAKLFDNEPGVPLGNPGHGVDLPDQTYTGAGEWQQLSWYYGDKPEAQSAKVVYFYPLKQQARSSPGTIYFDDLNIEVRPDPGNFPWLQDFYDWIDGLLAQYRELDTEYKALLAAATAAGASIVILNFLRDFIQGLSEGQGIAQHYRDNLTRYLQAHPTMNYWGAIQGASVMAALTYAGAMEATGPLGWGLLLGQTLAFKIMMTNTMKVMVSYLESKVLNPYTMPELDFSGGLPADKKTIGFYPLYADKASEIWALQDNIAATWLANESPNLQIWVLLNGAPDRIWQEIHNMVAGEGQFWNPNLNGDKGGWDTSLKSKYGDHFGAVFTSKLHWNGEKLRWEQWFKKEGALMTLMAWLTGDLDWLQTPLVPRPEYSWVHNRIAAADTVQWEVGRVGSRDCSIRACYLPGGFAVPLGGHAVVTDQSIMAFLSGAKTYWTYDAANEDLVAEGYTKGGLTRGVAKLWHPDNYNSSAPVGYRFKHALLQQWMVPDPRLATNPHESLFAKTMGREAGRMRFVVDAMVRISKGGTFFGKGGGSLEDMWYWLKQAMPDIWLSHDMGDGKLGNVAILMDCPAADDMPPHAMAGFVRSGRWCNGDVWHLTGQKVYPGNWAMFKDKLPRLPGEMVQLHSDSIWHTLKSIENVRGRFGDPAMLAWWLGTTVAKFFPQYIGGRDPATLEAVFWAAMISIIAMPKLSGVKNSGELIRALEDTVTTTLTFLPNTIHETVSLYGAIKKLIKGEILDPSWPTAGSQKAFISLYEMLEYNRYAFYTANALMLMNISAHWVTGAALNWLDIIPYVAMGGGGSFLTWLQSKTPAQIETAGGILRMTWKECGRALDKFLLSLAPLPPDLISTLDTYDVPKDAIPAEFIEEFLPSTYMYDEGATLRLVYVDPRTGQETQVGLIEYRTAGDELVIMDLQVAENLDAITQGAWAKDQVALALLLDAFAACQKAGVKITALAVLLDLVAEGQPLAAVIAALQADACIIVSDAFTPGGYQHYFITDRMKNVTPPVLPMPGGPPRNLIVLAGGLGSRLQGDLSQYFPSLYGSSKPLVPVAGRPILEHIIDMAQSSGIIGDIYITTSQASVPGPANAVSSPAGVPFAEQKRLFFDGFGDGPAQVTYKPDGTIDMIELTYNGRGIHIVNVGEPGGAIADLKRAMDKAGLTGNPADFMVVGGDNLFTELDLGQLAAYAANKGAPTIGTYQVPLELAHKYGQVRLDLQTGLVLDFAEKADPPISDLASVLAYYITEECVALIQQYLNAGQSPDNIGNLFPYFRNTCGQRIYGYPVRGVWYDIGDGASLKRANATYFGRSALSSEHIRQALDRGAISLGSPAHVPFQLPEPTVLLHTPNEKRYEAPLIYKGPSGNTEVGRIRVRKVHQTLYIEDFTLVDNIATVTDGQIDAFHAAWALVCRAHDWGYETDSEERLVGIIVEHMERIFEPGMPLRNVLTAMHDPNPYLWRVKDGTYMVTSHMPKAKYDTDAMVEMMILEPEHRSILTQALASFSDAARIIGNSAETYSLVVADRPLIEQGTFLGSNVKFLPGGLVQFTLNGEVYKVTVSDLLALTKGAYGLESLKFRFFDGQGAASVVALSAAGVAVTESARPLGLPGSAGVVAIEVKRALTAADEASAAVIETAIEVLSKEKAAELMTWGGGGDPTRLARLLVGVEGTGKHYSYAQYESIAGLGRLTVKSDWDEILGSLPQGFLEILDEGDPTGVPLLTMQYLPGRRELFVGGRLLGVPSALDSELRFELDDLVLKEVQKYTAGGQVPPPDMAVAGVFDKQRGRFSVEWKGVKRWSLHDPDQFYTLSDGQSGRADLFLTVDLDGQQFAIVTRVKSTPTNMERLARWTKNTALDAMRFLKTPAGRGIIAFGATATIVLIAYEIEGGYIPTDRWIGDILIGGGVSFVSAGMNALLIHAASKALEASGAQLGFAGATILSWPLVALTKAGVAYLPALYRQWRVGQTFPVDDLLPDAPGYRAWLVAYDQLKRGWLDNFAPRGSGVQAALGRAIAAKHMADWELSDEGMQTLQTMAPFERGPVLASPEAWEKYWAAVKLQKDTEYIAEQAALPYQIKYEELITEPVLRGLSYKATGESPTYPSGGSCTLDWDEYGCLEDRDACWPGMYTYAQLFPSNTIPGDLDVIADGLPVYVPVPTIRDKLIENIHKLWTIYAYGEQGSSSLASLAPIAGHLGYTPSLEELRWYVCTDLMGMRENFIGQWIDGSISSWVLAPSYIPRFVWNAGLHERQLDCRVAVPFLSELAVSLAEADLGSYGYYDTLLPNPGFESKDSSRQVHVIQTVTNDAVSLSSTQTLRGVRYWWDVRGQNAAGDGLKSGQRSFVPTTAP